MDALYRTITSLLMGLMSAIGIQMPPATWQLQTMGDGRTVSLTFSDHPHSSHSATFPIDQFEGLKPLLQSSGPARFRLKRDAGVFEFDGVLRSGSGGPSTLREPQGRPDQGRGTTSSGPPRAESRGGGTMEFVPSETFPAELAKRGFDKPTRVEQLKMAWHDTGFALIDELASLKYERPTLQQLVSAGDHGVDRTYVREMSAAGYQLRTVDALIRQHDHGVSAAYVRDLASLGLKNLSADDLVRARDHGIGPEYVRDMVSLGYKTLTVGDFVTARDHGVGPEYVRELGALGYRNIALADLVRLRDHGVNPAWLRVVNDRNRGTLSIDQLVSLRDHGVDTLDDLRRRTHAS
jgi:hypothetical protein